VTTIPFLTDFQIFSLRQPLNHAFAFTIDADITFLFT